MRTHLEEGLVQEDADQFQGQEEMPKIWEGDDSVPVCTESEHLLKGLQVFKT